MIFESSYTPHLVSLLPTINWLLEVKRVDLAELHSKIIQFILAQDFTKELLNKIKKLDDKARLQYYKIFLKSRLPTYEEIKIISQDKNFLVRILLIDQLQAFERPIQKELIDAFLQDKSASVRQQALYASKKSIEDHVNRILILLSDESASVRELSMSLLKYKGIDYATLYRERIADKQFLSGSLIGLSETGNSNDLPIFEEYIKAEKSKLVISCLNAINKFSEDKARLYSLKFLVHPTKQVRDKAVDILSKSSDSETLLKVRDIFFTGTYDTKDSILKLYDKVGGWNIIGDLLRALLDENSEIQNLSWLLLKSWKLKSTKLFTTPPENEIKRAKIILSHLENRIPMLPREKVSLLEEIRFYLG